MRGNGVPEERNIVKSFIRKTVTIAVLLAFLATPALSAYAAEATTPSGIPLSEMRRRIDELVAHDMDEDTPGFAIAVVKDGEVVLSQGYGYADINLKIPVDSETTIFEYGSISKVFVYVSVMQLVEQGLLDLDADVATYLPEDLNQQFDFEYRFTVRDLINHSAGFGEHFFNSFSDAENTEGAMTLREGLLATQPKQIFEPGTASSYSNFGIGLTAFIVSQVSGQDYAEYEREHILTPLDMSHTKNQPDWTGNTEYLQAKAKGYMPDGDSVFQEAPWWYISAYPAGALNGTADDLVQLARALSPPAGEPGPLFKNRETLDLMLSPSYSDPSKMRGTNHGLFHYDGSYPSFGHAGSTGGFNTEFAIVPFQRFGVVMLSNANGGMVFNNKMLDLLLGSNIDSLPLLSDGLPDASEVAGSYTMLRRHTGNLLELANPLLAGVRVKALDENTIMMETMGLTQTYVQVQPYVFRADTPGTLARMSNELTFRMEEGKSVALSMGTPFDATGASFTESTTFLIAGVILVVVCTVFFLVVPIVALVRFLRRKDKKLSRFAQVSNGLLLSGMLFVLNTVMFIINALKDFSPAGPFITSSVVAPHVLFNYILLTFTIALFVASVFLYRKDKPEKKRKILYFSTVSLLALFVTMLWHWNFFVFM